MKNRRRFLAAVSGLSTSGLALAMGAASDAQTPVPAASPSTSEPAPSAAAAAIAATYRAFDSRLSSSELRAIAHAIDDDRRATAVMRSKAKPLRNADDLVVRFVADEPV